ncbi:hypothetical protein MOUN0_A03136 [Monosporozyma unispora]
MNKLRKEKPEFTKGKKIYMNKKKSLKIVEERKKKEYNGGVSIHNSRMIILYYIIFLTRSTHHLLMGMKVWEEKKERKCKQKIRKKNTHITHNEGKISEIFGY